MEDWLHLDINLNGDEDPERTLRLTRALQRELAQLVDAGSVKLGATPAPDGSKSGEVIAVATLVVTLAAPLVPNVFEHLKNWTGRAKGQVLTVQVYRGDTSTRLSLEVGNDMPKEEILEAIRRVLGSNEAKV